MEFALCAGITVRSGKVNAVIAPEELAVTALTGHDDLRRFLFLCVFSPSSRLLTGIRDTSPNLDALTVIMAAELRALFDAACHTVVFVEHDPAWYDRHEEMIPLVSHALSTRALQALVILYARKSDRTFDVLSRKADRVFFFARPPVPSRHHAWHRVRGSCEAPGRSSRQPTLEVT